MITKSRAAKSVLLTCCLGYAPANAQTEIKPLERPDPATITVPDMTFKPSPSDIRSFDNYFYFYKFGVSYERAFADLDQCRMFGQMVRLAPVPPRFVPLGSDAHRPLDPNTWAFFPTYGVVGMMFAGWLIDNATEDAAQADRYRCMGYRGYQRYGISRAIFRKIDSGTDAEKLSRQARIASGPAPLTEALEP